MAPRDRANRHADTPLARGADSAFVNFAEDDTRAILLSAALYVALS